MHWDAIITPSNTTHFWMKQYRDFSRTSITMRTHPPRPAIGRLSWVFWWKLFPQYCPFVRGIHWISPHKGSSNVELFSLVVSISGSRTNSPVASDYEAQVTALSPSWPWLQVEVELQGHIYPVIFVPSVNLFVELKSFRALIQYKDDILPV